MPHKKDNSHDYEKDLLLHNSEGSSLNSANHDGSSSPRVSQDSVTTASTTSLVLENLNQNAYASTKKPSEPFEYRDDTSDLEVPPPTRWSKHSRTGSMLSNTSMSRSLKIIISIISIIAISGWALALFSLLSKKAYKHDSTLPYDHEAPGKSAGKKISWESIQNGEWGARRVNLNWIAGANGEDGLLLEIQQPGKGFMVVEDVRARQGATEATYASKTLMESGWFTPINGGGGQVWTENYWPSPDLKKVLVISSTQKVYRHSFVGNYYIFDVETQTAEVLDPGMPNGQIQLAKWGADSKSIAFTRDNNLYVRLLQDSAGEKTTAVRQITTDGGPEYFYGIPDWVYEEEVFEGNSAMWWDREGKFVAFMRTNETMVPEYPVEYFISTPSGVVPPKGLEKYPDEKRIKYPKAGAPNPIVDMLFYDLEANEAFEVEIEGGFADDDRLIADVLWADNGKVLIKELNRVSDRVRVVLVDVKSRTGKVVRTLNVKELDGGWVEPGQVSRYVPADPDNGRPEEGYVDLVFYDDADHLGYFSPLDSSEPLMLTKGHWEVVQGTAALDLKNNLVYFSAAKEHSTQRHVYSVDLQGQEIKPIVPVDKPGYYTASFSNKAGYVILNNEGPSIPSQKLVSTPANPNTYSEILEENVDLAKKAAQHEMPHLVYSNLTVEGNVTINILERRPPHFDPKKQYPVLFQLYGGPGSQMVTRRFNVDFQSYIASSLGYVVVTVDGRGTGFIGRSARTLIRGNLGYYESLDQITAAKEWASKSYVDADRMAIWGWSYGGYMTLKVLETDAGQTFKYGMAVAPVTDWQFYDSIYTERFMLTPQTNPIGYASSAINNVTALRQNVRWLMMHGVSDDNVHMQNTLTLLDKLDLAGVKNYDAYFFPDSDHGIYFHNANSIVYQRLRDFLVNAFNGVFYDFNSPKPQEMGDDFIDVGE